VAVAEEDGAARVDSREARELFGQLRRLHVHAGEPSSRVLAERADGLSHTTVNQALKGRRIPSWPILARIVTALGGDEEEFRILWSAVRDNRGSIDELPSPLSANRPDVLVFASYARVDDRATYGRIETFINDVSNIYSSMTGMDVGIFFDKDSISPGEEWKDRIRLGLSASSVLLAFISPAYLRSVNCTQEFWEFLHFLRANSTTRLIVPLLFAESARMEKNFSNDRLWVEASRLNRRDISDLRFEQEGSRRWLQLANEVAGVIEDVLSDVADRAPGEAMPGESAARAVAASENFDILGRIQAVEQSAPELISEMQRLLNAINAFGAQMSPAGALMARATTTKRKVSISRQLARQLDPIADDMVDSSTKIRLGIDKWDESISAIVEFTRRYPDWLQVSEDGDDGIQSIRDLAESGIESFGELDHVYEVFQQGRGLSAALDVPLRKAQDALLAMTDVRGVFIGWRDAIDGLTGA
jgi:TIR domain